MLTKEMIERINELARKKRSVGLSAEELDEQKALYREYLGNIRENLTAVLDNIEFVDVDSKSNHRKNF